MILLNKLVYRFLFEKERWYNLMRLPRRVKTRLAMTRTVLSPDTISPFLLEVEVQFYVIP
jgi:hypothetical protein